MICKMNRVKVPFLLLSSHNLVTAVCMLCVCVCVVVVVVGGIDDIIIIKSRHSNNIISKCILSGSGVLLLPQ